MSAAAAIIDAGKYTIAKNYFTYSYISTFTVTPVSTVAGGKSVNYTFSVKP